MEHAGRGIRLRPARSARPGAGEGDADEPRHEAEGGGDEQVLAAIGCAAANASLDLWEREPRLLQAEALEQKLWDGLKHIEKRDRVRDVRVKGGIGVIEMDITRADILKMRAKAPKLGTWLRPFGDILYTCPPLNINDADLAVLIEAMDKLSA